MTEGQRALQRWTCPCLYSLKVSLLRSWSRPLDHPVRLVQDAHSIYFCILGLSKMPNMLEELNEEMNKYLEFKGGFSCSQHCAYHLPRWTVSAWKGSNWVLALHHFLKKNKGKRDSLRNDLLLRPHCSPPQGPVSRHHQLAHSAAVSSLAVCQVCFPQTPYRKGFAQSSQQFSVCLIKVSPQPIDLSNAVLFLIISPNASFNFHSVTKICHPYNSPEFHFVVYNFLSNEVSKLHSATCFYTVCWRMTFKFSIFEKSQKKTNTLWLVKMIQNAKFKIDKVLLGCDQLVYIESEGCFYAVQ